MAQNEKMAEEIRIALEQYAAGDTSQESKLVELNMGLVSSIAVRFRGRGVDYEDLMQIGSIGLLKAIRSFDLSRGYAFSTYAVPLIIGEIRRFLRDDGTIKVSRTVRRTGAALMREYQIAAHLTFSNSLLREEHLTDKKCNALCALFEKNGMAQNGVIISSELLLDYLRKNYPGLYFISSTTKVLTEFEAFERELGIPLCGAGLQAEQGF